MIPKKALLGKKRGSYLLEFMGGTEGKKFKRAFEASSNRYPPVPFRLARKRGTVLRKERQLEPGAVPDARYLSPPPAKEEEEKVRGKL